MQAFSGRRDEAIERLERAFAVISSDEPDEDIATLAAQLSRAYWFSGDLQRAGERAELALEIAESHAFAKPMPLALRAKGAVLYSRGHPEEATALMKHALDFALEHDFVDDARAGYFILSDRAFRRDRYQEALDYLEQALAMARKGGDRPGEWSVLAEKTYPLLMLGRWDEVLAIRAEFTEEQIHSGGVVLSLLQAAVEIYVNRGALDEARELVALFSRLENSSDLQDRACYTASLAVLRRGEGRLEEAVTAAEATMESLSVFALSAQALKHGLVDGVEAALARGDGSKAEELMSVAEGALPGQRPPYLDAHMRRLRARMAGDPSALEAAAGLFRELEIPFWVAVTLLEHAELTGSEESRFEALEIFERLQARPWAERAGAGAQVEAEIPA
jgi:tetratricopeptide (TPR) repeat protein